MNSSAWTRVEFKCVDMIYNLHSSTSGKLTLPATLREHLLLRP